jgi:predicted deacylase
VEAGHAGTTESDDIEALVRGSMNVMRHLRMLPGDAPKMAPAVWIERYSVVAADREGVFYPAVVPEAYVRKGQRIGSVTDYFGDPVMDVVSPVSGVVIYIRAVPSLKKGDTVGYIGELAETPGQ